MPLNLYAGTFCWHGESHYLHTQAGSEKQAFLNFCNQVAGRVGYNRSAVVNYFLNTDKYAVNIDKGGG